MPNRYFLLFILVSTQVYAQQLISLSPVSENTVLLKFDEGEKDFSNFNGFYFYDAPNLTYYGTIDETQALVPDNFLVSSPDDSNYTTPQNASLTYFKAKEQVALMEYYVYLRLPEPMLQGKTYSIEITNIGNQENNYTFVYNVYDLFSESIHVNQIGMIPISNKKYAYISQWLGKSNATNSNYEDFTALEGTTCHIVRATDNTIIYSGSGTSGLKFRAPITEADYGGNFATQYWYNSPVWEFDFSQVGTTIDIDETDEYKVVIEGIGCSFPFKISSRAYDEVYKTIANSLLYQRSGFERTNEYAPFIKPIDHVPGVDGFQITYSNYREMDNTGGDTGPFEELPAQATEFINPTNQASWMNSPDDLPWGSGGHFDAGDFDVNTKHLLLPIMGSLIYKLAPNGFKDGDLNIPENNNGIPDILDEIKWTLDFFKRTKGPTGGICGGKETTSYPSPPYNDGSGESSSEQMWYVYKEDPAASFSFAAASAIFAEALQIADASSSEVQLYIQAAIDAYEWAELNATQEDLDQLYSGFIYNGTVKDLKLMAASMLYSATGNQQYLDYYKNNTIVNLPTVNLYQFEQWDESLANWSFITIPTDKWSNFDQEAINLKNTQIQATLLWSDDWGINDTALKPFRFIKSQYQPPILGTTGSTPQLLPQIMAYHLSNDQDLLDSMLASNDMYLGGNAENKVFITRADLFGAERYAKDILHDASMRNAGVAVPGIPLYTHSLDKQELFLMSPPISDWPYMEMNLDARVYFLQSEFTIAQNTIPTMMIYGYLNAIVNQDLLNLNDFSGNDFEVYRVFPNPSNGLFTIKLPSESNEEIRIFDLNGKRVSFNEISSINNFLTLEISNVRSGIYFVNFLNKDKSFTKKILIKK